MEKKWTILLADDEKDLREILKLVLEREGYTAIVAENGEQVLEQQLQEIDLFILDVDMPKLNGVMTAVEIRKNYDTPIIFLTAFSAETDKIMGFSVGADDYIAKPVSNMELLMRIRAVLKRTYGRGEENSEEELLKKDMIRIEDIFLDKNSQSILREEERIPLTDKEFRILELLATHRKKIFSLQNLYESIWEEKMVSENVIMAHIKNLRKKLGDTSKGSKYIKTAWGRGYYLD